MPAELRALQERFYALVTAPEGVEAGLRTLGLTSADLEADVRGNARLSAVARLDLYANMYFYRILDVLRDEYEKVLAIVGDAVFHNLVTDYLVQCRPSHPSLRNAGRRFAGFLLAHPSTTAQPWLAELAHLERARLEVFDAADAGLLTVDALRVIPPDELAAVVVRRVPACVDVVADHAVERVWQAISHGEGVTDPAPEKRQLIVWRHESDVWQRPLGPLERMVWPALVNGIAIGALCEQLSELVDEDEVATQAFQLIGSWASDGLLTRV